MRQAMGNFGFVQLFCIVSLLVGVELRCLDGWVTHHDSCYYFEDLVKKTWTESLMYCQGKGAHLVVIDSVEENNFIKHELTKLHPGSGTSIQFWTAGNDISSEGHWVWGTSSDRVALNVWPPGEPNQKHGDEDCMSFYPHNHGWNWNDSVCHLNMFFICEMEDTLAVITG